MFSLCGLKGLVTIKGTGEMVKNSEKQDALH